MASRLARFVLPAFAVSAMFVAAPALITTLYRLKAPATSTQITKGWAS